MTKPNAQTILKALAATTATGAVIDTGIQLAGGHPNLTSLTLTLVSVIFLGVVLGDDIRRIVRTARAHRRAVTFRKRHGDPSTWDNNEYEAYFALTAPQTPAHRNIHPAA